MLRHSLNTFLYLINNILLNVYTEILEIVITHPLNAVMLIKQRHLSFTTPCVCLELLRFEYSVIQSPYLYLLAMYHITKQFPFI